MPITPRAAANPARVLDPAALASARATVQTELRLLEGGEQDLFRETFLPSVQPQITAEAFAACRKRVRQVPVAAGLGDDRGRRLGGHRVVRVSMFGKSMTGFHEVDGRGSRTRSGACQSPAVGRVSASAKAKASLEDVQE